MALDYSSVRRQYDLLYGVGVTRKSMPEWASEMNSLTSSNLYDRGLHDGWWTRASNWADENVFHPVADVTTAPIGAAVGGLFGHEEAGREVGRDLLRNIVETAPLTIPGVGIPITAGLMAAHTYADTGSGKAALVSGLAGAALPLAGRFAGPLAARAFGTAEKVAAGEFATETGTQAFTGGWLPKEGSELGFKLATFAGSQAAQGVVNEAAMFTQSKIAGTDFDPLSPEFLLQQIPFTLFDVMHGVRAKVPTAKSMEARRIVETPKERPERVVPPSTVEEEAQREALFLRLQDVTNNPEATPDERAAALDAAIKGTTDTPGVIALKKAAKPGTSQEVELTGWGKQQENGNWKVVVDPERSPGVELPEHGNVFVNQKDATKNPDGSVTFRTTLDKVNGKVQYPLRREEADPNQPNLPVQKNGLSPDETRIFEKVGVKVPEVDPLMDPVKNPQGTVAAIEEIKRRNAPLRPIAQEIEQIHATLESAKEKIATVPKSAEEVATMVDPEVVKPQIETAIKEGHTPTQAVEQARLSTHTPIVDAALEQENVLKDKAEKVISVVGGEYSAEKPQAKYSGPVRDENGENFQSRALAEAYRDANPEFVEYTVRDAGRGKGFYLAKQVNREVSLEGTNLEAVISDPTPVDSRPDVSIQDVLGTLDRAGRNVDVFDEILGNNDVVQTLKELRFTKEFLRKTLAGEKISLDDEMRQVVSKVTQATGEWNGRFRSWEMESEAPHDPELVKQMGVLEGGAKSTLEWFSQHEKAGAMGQLVADMLKVRDLAGFDFRQNLREGFRYFPGRNPFITYGKLPSNENEAFRFALNTAHEMAHHLGADILTRADPQSVAFRATLNKVLYALEKSEHLPKEVKAAVTKAKAEGWYDTYADGKIDSVDLRKRFYDVAGENNQKWFSTFYGMQNEHELFAQVFTDHDFVNLLAKTKMERTKTQTVLQFFSQAWNRLFGGRVETDNALHEILTQFENYLGGPQVGGGEPLYNGRDYLRDALLAKGVRPEALASRLDTVEKVFNTGDLSHSIEGFARETAAGTLPATSESGPINEVFRKALQDGLPTEVYQTTKNLLAAEVPVHQDLWARMRQDVSTAQELRRNIEKGFVPGTVPEGLEEKLSQAFTKLNAFKNGLDKNAAAIERWGDLQNFTTEGFEDTLAGRLVNRRLPAPPDPTGNEDIARGLLGLTDELTEIRRETAAAELEGKKVAPGLVTRWVQLTQHVKKQFPALRPVIDAVRLQFSKQFEDHRTLKLVYDGFNPETGELDKSVRRNNDRIATTESLQKAASNMRRHINIWEQKGETWNYDRSELQDILGKFNAKDRTALLQEANSGRARYHAWTEVIVPQKLSQLNTANTAKVIAAHEVGMLPEQARELSHGMYDALAALQDPAQAVGGNEMLRQISTKMQPQTFIAALRYAQDMVTQANKDLTLMRSRPSYAPEQRYDSDHLVMQGPEGQAFRAGGDRKRLLGIRKEKEAQGYVFLDYIPKSDVNTPVGIRSEFLDAMREADLLRAQRMDVALSTVDPQVRAMVLADSQRTSQYESLANAFKPLPRVTRNFAEGREYLNMLRNEDEFYSRSLNWYRHQITRAETSLDMMYPEVAGNRALKDYAMQHVENALTPDNPFMRKLIKTVYFQRLAFSLGNSLLESVQNLGTGMQAVIAETGSIRDAFKLWGQAIGEITRKGARSEEMQWMFKRAEDMGLRRITTFRDIHDPDSESAHEILGKSPLMKGASALQAGATKWATMFQRFNDDIGLAAGFRLGLEKNMSREEAFNFAWDLKERGLYTGGKAQRPVGLWIIKTKPVPQLLSALQTYTLGWFSQMSTDWKIGFRDLSGDFSETQRSGSRKAFVYGLAAQATLAGALGLPGVGQGLALLKQATGLDLKGQLRSSLASLFDEDTENGGILTNLALRGGLAGISPIDPSNRAAISFPFVGIDPYKGFDISQLLGAPGASVSDAVKGALSAMKGDFVGFQKLLPSVLRPPLTLLQGEGDVRDARGGLLQTLTPAERFVTAIGLPSSRIQAARDTSEAVKSLNDQAVREREQLVDSLATAYRKQGSTLGQQQLVAYLHDHPQEDGAALVRAIASRVRAQTLPYDYRRDVSKNVDLHGLGSRMPSSELEGRKLEYDVQKNLGLMPRFNIRADMNAISVDQLLNSDPYLSRAAAVRQVSRTSRVPHRSTSLNFQPPQSLYQGE